MALFGWKSRAEREKRAAAPRADFLQSYSGMRVEVLGEDRELLFMAKLAITTGGLGELQEMTPGSIPKIPQWEEAAETETPPQPLHVQLRGFDEAQQLAIHLECDATPLNETTWRTERLRLLGKENDRAYYRQDIGVTAEIRRASPGGASQLTPCTVVNISVGGVCIQTEAAYEIDDTLLLRVWLLESSDLVVSCKVCRVTERRNGQFEYGCQFENLEPGQEDQISRAIMQLQMKRMKR